MSKIQKRLLLLARMLTLLFLVLAFAQPMWKNMGSGDRSNAAWVIFIDNSLSMDAGSGQQTLLDMAKSKATVWIQSQNENSFYVISNDALYQAQPLSKQEAIQAVQKIKISPLTVDVEQLTNIAQSLQESLFKKQIELLVFSDFQKNVWTSEKPLELAQGIELLLYPIQILESDPVNVYVDTAYFLETPVDPTQSVPLVSEIKKSGIGTPEEFSFFVQINDQNRSSRTFQFQESDSVLYDTTLVQLSPGKWNQILSGVSGRFLSMDDTFYMTAKINTLTNVLVYNQGAANAYLSAAFAAQNGVQPLQRSLTEQVENEDGRYALIVLQGLSALSEEQGKNIKKVLDNGGAVALFFGRNANPSALNPGLRQIGPIEVKGMDTSLQQMVDLQTAHPLMRDVVKTVPENVQLPFSQYGYKIKSGITAGAQDLMKFRDGSPYITQYHIGEGKLYVFASPLDPSSGNLIHSHLFAPIVHKMTVNNAGGSVYAATIDSRSSFWIQGKINDDREVYHLSKEDKQYIPRQQSKGMGTQIYVPEQLDEAGIYQVAYPSSKEDAAVGLNYNRIESEIFPATHDELKSTFSKGKVSVFNNIDQLRNFGTSGSSFPFWKIAIIFALLLFIAETYLLASRKVAVPQKKFEHKIKLPTN